MRHLKRDENGNSDATAEGGGESLFISLTKDQMEKFHFLMFLNNFLIIKIFMICSSAVVRFDAEIYNKKNFCGVSASKLRKGGVYGRCVAIF